MACDLCSKSFVRARDFRVHMKGSAHAAALAAADERAALRAAAAAALARKTKLREQLTDVARHYTTRLHRGLVSVPSESPAAADGLAAAVASHYATSRPRKHILRLRKALLGLAVETVAILFPAAELEVYGSIPLRLDSESSDIDVSIISDEDETLLLSTIADGVEALGLSSVTVARTLTARIPLITIADSLSSLELDLSIWKLDKLEINKVFTTYLSLDARIPPLLFAIRSWAKARNINNAYTGTINSFGLTVLGIAFLQSSGVVPVIEELPEVEAELATAAAAGPVANASHERIAAADHASAATPAADEDLGSMLVAFFEWLAAFDYDAHRISIRHGGVTSKEAHKFDDDTVFVIERPRTPYQNVTRQVSPDSLRRLVYEFRRARDILSAGGSLVQLLASD
ncbi:uncharacterized protein AMSG_00222 [Thecamonas trahens ATCC 50062]|uniref:C2H2-type domain-containing protein n=1 Tax=Thecamonas trahens ATCC 50062 TaxID=461836 RepID=A0A0L0D1W6_THETB|nr:hypothetical protein AMSG_00222 [Thecamonas trahens ATCC 50062]KNC46105.1 hypothetical protein AMSG_00222 [Thecamonas trahens ATCC 50062]|eukprot:XP_013763083.1 hypothetical protein AMSG_00222 [Thecamonas trahens ATCC 50062]